MVTSYLTFLYLFPNVFAPGPMQLVDGTVNSEGTRPLHPELQFARCMSNRYKSEKFPRCVSCTRRWAGDTCRFQGIRFFLKDDQRNIVGISFVENQKADAPSMDFPVRWNIPLEPVHTRRMKVGNSIFFQRAYLTSILVIENNSSRSTTHFT
jgi:hypothetical protein